MLPNIERAIARAGLTPSPALDAEIREGCGLLSLGADAVIEMSRCLVHREPDGRGGKVDAGLLLLFRFDLGILHEVGERGGLFRSRPSGDRDIAWVELSGVTAVEAAQDRSGAAALQLFGEGHRAGLRLAWRDAPAERDRLAAAVRAAVARDFSTWDPKPDPDTFREDFDRAYQRALAEAPADLAGYGTWAAALGEYPRGGGAAAAIDWRRAEVFDLAWPNDRTSSRVLFLREARSYAGQAPQQAKELIVALGEGLWDEGALAPPYDERDPSDPWHQSEPGPSRLIAVMTLAAYARDLGHPRTSEWAAAARQGLEVVPQEILPAAVHDLWAPLAETA